MGTDLIGIALVVAASMACTGLGLWRASQHIRSEGRARATDYAWIAAGFGLGLDFALLLSSSGTGGYFVLAFFCVLASTLAGPFLVPAAWFVGQAAPRGSGAARLVPWLALVAFVLVLWPRHAASVDLHLGQLRHWMVPLTIATLLAALGGERAPRWARGIAGGGGLVVLGVTLPLLALSALYLMVRVLERPAGALLAIVLWLVAGAMTVVCLDAVRRLRAAGIPGLLGLVPTVVVVALVGAWARGEARPHEALFVDPDAKAEALRDSAQALRALGPLWGAEYLDTPHRRLAWIRHELRAGESLEDRALALRLGSIPSQLFD